MRSAYPSEWLNALDRAEAMKADVYIPGHGFTENGVISHEELTSFQAALRAVIAEARRLHGARIAIRKVYEELDGHLK
jgi:hypothetical protein